MANLWVRKSIAELQAEAARLDHRLGAGADVERAQDRRDVDLDGALREAQLAADDLVRLALQD